MRFGVGMPAVVPKKVISIEVIVNAFLTKKGLYNTAKSFIKLFAYTKTFFQKSLLYSKEMEIIKNLSFDINLSKPIINMRIRKATAVDFEELYNIENFD